MERTSGGVPDWYLALTSPSIVSGAPGRVTAVRHDSRQVTPGALFVAIPGLSADGHRFIGQAIGAGATGVVVQQAQEAVWRPYITETLTFISVLDTRVALAEVAAGYFAHPARSLGMVGVTGTDGKTTTSHLIAHLMSASGRAAGLLSSVEFVAGGVSELNASHMTTVEADEVQRRLAAIRDSGDAYAVVEASSHGLDLHRVDQCEFDVGVFTNLAPDHLDYHGDMTRYREAKATLFRMLNTSSSKRFPKAAVLNMDDAASSFMADATSAKKLTYGLRNDGDVRATNIVSDGFGMSFGVRMDAAEVAAHVPLVGAYNVANCLAAIAAAVSLEIPLREVVDGLATFPGVPGRMELIEEGQPFRVVVDIASTEQAMRNVLAALRPVASGRLIVVFGAAGERDTERRRGLGRAVAEIADRAVLANEDPRSEDPDKIIEEIAAEMQRCGRVEERDFVRCPDRRKAIQSAFAEARTGDTVLLAGKGTEQSIVIGKHHEPWDERVVARELLSSGWDV